MILQLDSLQTSHVSTATQNGISLVLRLRRGLPRLLKTHLVVGCDFTARHFGLDSLMVISLVLRLHRGLSRLLDTSNGRHRNTSLKVRANSSIPLEACSH